MSPSSSPGALTGEHTLIERLLRRVGSTRPPFVEIGIGDDAAALWPERGMVDVVTTDCLVEGVHFRRDWSRWRDVGHKALAVNLSDIAAMGAKPRACLLSLVLPGDFAMSDFDELVDGFVSLAEASESPLVGGNLARSPGPVIITVTALGFGHPRRLLCRDGAKAGDELFITGAVGGAAAALRALQSGRAVTLDETCLARYERPEARLRCGWIAARSRAVSAAMDLSDGLADAARQMSRASGVGIVIEAEAVPVEPGAREWALNAGEDLLELALSGGEDYELAFAVAPRRRRAFLGAMSRCRGLAVTRIGKFVPEPGAWLLRGDRRESLPQGFEHFEA